MEDKKTPKGAMCEKSVNNEYRFDSKLITNALVDAQVKRIDRAIADNKIKMEAVRRLWLSMKE